ncbi:hypothetical protein VN1291_04490 [Helicobacter pylori]|nr:hypothetical protein [Helicobacter pylori]BDO44678.1 hypothetical protein VN1291_07790 [Helicobacter pylori]BDO46284.1 hypothetical protein CHC155_07770 [Helicobacter pylori]GHQ44817.1 hypothetical protein VN0361_08500 [Helicobacter pylori]GHS31591.1 hypothetical protein VN1291_04490 [Helicobacter pylori]
MPRVKLENIKLPDMKEIYVNQWYINIYKYIDILYQRGFLYTDRRLKE